MGWDKKKRGGRYYTRSRKVNGRVVREYVGGGVIGQCAEIVDVQAREERLEQEARAREEARRIDQIERAVRGLYESIEAEVSSALEAEGYRKHKGEWRRQRNGGEHG